MTSPRMTTVRTIARRSASTYSRKVDLMRALARVAVLVVALAMGVPPFNAGSPLDPEDREERFLRDPDGADLLHALFPLALLLEELPFPCDIAAVALGDHVLAQGRDRLPGDHVSADRRLDGDREHLARNQLFQFDADVASPLVGALPV